MRAPRTLAGMLISLLGGVNFGVSPSLSESLGSRLKDIVVVTKGPS